MELQNPEQIVDRPTSFAALEKFHTMQNRLVPIIKRRIRQLHRSCCREELIALAILRLIEMEKAVVEGAGAVGLAAVLGNLVPEFHGKK